MDNKGILSSEVMELMEELAETEKELSSGAVQVIIYTLMNLDDSSKNRLAKQVIRTIRKNKPIEEINKELEALGKIKRRKM